MREDPNHAFILGTPVHIVANKELHSFPDIREKFSSEEKSSFETFPLLNIFCSVKASCLL
jgi:hypothetical protein